MTGSTARGDVGIAPGELIARAMLDRVSMGLAW